MHQPCKQSERQVLTRSFYILAKRQRVSWEHQQHQSSHAFNTSDAFPRQHLRSCSVHMQLIRFLSLKLVLRLDRQALIDELSIVKVLMMSSTFIHLPILGGSPMSSRLYALGWTIWTIVTLATMRYRSKRSDLGACRRRARPSSHWHRGACASDSQHSCLAANSDKTSSQYLRGDSHQLKKIHTDNGSQLEGKKHISRCHKHHSASIIYIYIYIYK